MTITDPLVGLLADAGLTGRGGAAFPTAAKLAAARRGGAELIVNACDGEIGSAKDGWVVTHRLAELTEAARIVAGDRFRVAAHRGSPALAALNAAGVPALPVPHRYVSSEESALVQLANGGLARPLMRTAPITAGGPGFPPSLVLNAETVWRIGQLTHRGPAWFRSFGTADEPGPRLVTIGGAVARPGVYETAAGIGTTALLDLAGGPNRTPKALWLNGIGGGFLGMEEAARTAWSADGLRPYGLRIGAATVSVIGARTGIPQLVQDAMAYAAGESAGQCGPCMFGVPALARDVAILTTGRATGADRQRMRIRLARLPGRGACRYPDGVAGFVASALRVFGDDFAAVPDPAGVAR